MLKLTFNQGERVRLKTDDGLVIWIELTDFPKRRAARVSFLAPDSVAIVRESLLEPPERFTAAEGKTQRPGSMRAELPCEAPITGAALRRRVEGRSRGGGQSGARQSGARSGVDPGSDAGAPSAAGAPSTHLEADEGGAS